MKFLIKLYKSEMILFFFIGSLFLWGTVTSLLAFKNKTQVFLIGKTDESYQLITDEEKAPLETGNFIRHFLALILNFNDESYKKHISLAGDLMTERLWEKKKSEFIKMADFIKKNKVTQSAEILKIQKVKSNLYEATIKNYLFKNGLLTEKNKLHLTFSWLITKEVMKTHGGIVYQILKLNNFYIFFIFLFSFSFIEGGRAGKYEVYIF